MSTTLIRNGKIVNADRTQEADRLISRLMLKIYCCF